MKQPKISWCLAIFLLTTAPISEAQDGKKIRWIGYLAGSGSSPNQAFVQGMRDLGYVEGKNIAFVYRTAEGRRERYSDIAGELVRLRVEVIVADNTSAALALKKATNSIPIVVTNGTNPVGTGLVESLARPGGNVTGLTSVGGETGDKLLELLKEIAPRLTRVAILGTKGSRTTDVFLKETEVPARVLGIQLLRSPVEGPDDIDGAFRAMTKERADGLLVRLNPSLYSVHYKRVAELAASSRLPSISADRGWVDAGGLMTYGSNLNFQYRRAATYVDKIIKGTKPADLPVEAPTKFELVINLKTAKQIGVTIPQSMLYRADKVIKVTVASGQRSVVSKEQERKG